MNANSVVLEFSVVLALKDGSNRMMHMQAQWYLLPGHEGSDTAITWSIDPVETREAGEILASDVASSNYRLLEIISLDNGATCEAVIWSNGLTDSGYISNGCDSVDGIDNGDVLGDIIDQMYTILETSSLGLAMGLNLSTPTRIRDLVGRSSIL